MQENNYRWNGKQFPLYKAEPFPREALRFAREGDKQNNSRMFMFAAFASQYPEKIRAFL
jgi:hypothetical protein